MDIKLESWDYTCGDGCCYEWGVNLFLDGKQVEESFGSGEQAMEYVLVKVLGHKFESSEGDYYES